MSVSRRIHVTADVQIHEENLGFKIHKIKASWFLVNLLINALMFYLLHSLHLLFLWLNQHSEEHLHYTDVFNINCSKKYYHLAGTDWYWTGKFRSHMGFSVQVFHLTFVSLHGTGFRFKIWQLYKIPDYILWFIC